LKPSADSNLQSEIQLKMSIGFQMPGIKKSEHTFHRTPGLVLVGFRHDHQETLRLMVAALF
jgi:hypothetical protein